MRLKYTAVLLSLVVLSAAGCALKGGARHVAVVGETAIHTTLAAAQDAETAMFNAGEPSVVANHASFNRDLVPLLEAGDSLNRVIRDWPVDKPAPAELPMLASRLQGLVRKIADNYPDSPGKSKLLSRFAAVSDVVVTLLITLPSAGNPSLVR